MESGSTEEAIEAEQEISGLAYHYGQDLIIKINNSPERVFSFFTAVEHFSCAISRSRVAQNLPNKEFELFESRRAGRVFKLPANSSSAGKSRKMRDQVNGCTFFGSFLYASKEMNTKYTLKTA